MQLTSARTKKPKGTDSEERNGLSFHLIIMINTEEKPWYDKEIMVQLYATDAIKSDEDIAEFFRLEGHDVSRRAITDARNSLSLPAKSKGAFLHIDKGHLETADREEIWGLVSKLQLELRKTNQAKKDVEIYLENDEPVGFFFMGDLHIGDVGTDHAALIRDVKKIQATEGLYGSLGGDYINNFILGGGKKIKNHEVIPVEFAWDLTEDLFQRLRESLWMILLGNHDEWTDKAAEFDKVAEMVNRIGVPYGKHGSNIHINFPGTKENPGQRYKIRLRHKYSFNSNQNLLNSVKQMYRFDEDFDIGALHHLHHPTYEAFHAQRGLCWAIRPGSYKVEDDFAYSLGYSKDGFGMNQKFGTEASCKYSVPVAILYPGERKIQVVPTIDEGIEYLSFAREQYSKKKLGG